MNIIKAAYPLVVAYAFHEGLVAKSRLTAALYAIKLKQIERESL